MSGIFKAYDIRGIYPTEINEDIAYKIGRAVASYLGAKTLAIGRDSRTSSPKLFEALTKGVMEQGCDVIDLGTITTPMVYYASRVLDVDGAVSLTASHNPAEYNGVKICRKNAVPVGENSGMLDIEHHARKEDFPESAERGSMRTHDIRTEYIKYISSFAKLGDRKFKMVIDAGNGMGSLEIDIFRAFPKNITLETIYDDIDLTFPNHEANPLKTETLEDLQKKVLETNADLGFSYDGDADRIGFVDGNGRIIPMDHVTALIAKVVLERHPGSVILYDLRSSKAVPELIKKWGGVPRECRVGHALIKKQMHEEGAIFAGELSGHYYFQENSFGESASLAALYILNLITEADTSLAELAKDVARYYHSGEINSEVKDKDAVIEKLKELYKDGEQSELDGLKVTYGDWWFNVRPSNTEPVLRLNLEADSDELMQKKVEEILKVIRG